MKKVSYGRRAMVLMAFLSLAITWLDLSTRYQRINSVSAGETISKRFAGDMQSTSEDITSVEDVLCGTNQNKIEDEKYAGVLMWAGCEVAEPGESVDVYPENDHGVYTDIHD